MPIEHLLTLIALNVIANLVSILLKWAVKRYPDNKLINKISIFWSFSQPILWLVLKISGGGHME